MKQIIDDWLKHSQLAIYPLKQAQSHEQANKPKGVQGVVGIAVDPEASRVLEQSLCRWRSRTLSSSGSNYITIPI